VLDSLHSRALRDLGSQSFGFLLSEPYHDLLRFLVPGNIALRRFEVLLVLGDHLLDARLSNRVPLTSIDEALQVCSAG